jgi:hypothetical protein
MRKPLIAAALLSLFVLTGASASSKRPKTITRPVVDAPHVVVIKGGDDCKPKRVIGPFATYGGAKAWASFNLKSGSFTVEQTFKPE